MSVIAAEVEVDFVDIGDGQVVRGDAVSATERIELDVLDAVEVHREPGDVACEACLVPVGRDVDFSLTLAPLNSSVSVPAPPSSVSLPSLGSMSRPAGLTEQLVVARAAGDLVVTVAAEDHWPRVSPRWPR